MPSVRWPDSKIGTAKQDAIRPNPLMNDTEKYHVRHFERDLRQKQPLSGRV